MGATFAFARAILHVQSPSLELEVVEFAQSVGGVAHVVKLGEGVREIRSRDDVGGDKGAVGSEQILKLLFLDVLGDVRDEESIVADVLIHCFHIFYDINSNKINSILVFP